MDTPEFCPPHDFRAGNPAERLGQDSLTLRVLRMAPLPATDHPARCTR